MFKNKSWKWWWPQILLATILLFCTIFFSYQLIHNYTQQNIASGFNFLNLEAGFEISESITSFSSSERYLDALVVGALNTFKVSVIGNIFALSLGLMFGLSLLLKNKIVYECVNQITMMIRNVPLLLQLLFCYAIFSDVLPSVREAWNVGEWLYLSNRGIYFIHSLHSIFLKILVVLFLSSIFFTIYFHNLSLKIQASSGLYPAWWKKIFFILAIEFMVILYLHQWDLGLSWPVLAGFNFQGGYHLTPEFCSLLFGLILYTSAFMAEIVRSAILWVSKGQKEAALSLGFNKRQIFFLIVLPQSLKVMIPPLVGQVLNLVKNSTLAVAIAYPDFVSIANTTLNQTGQAVELVFFIMVFYLCISLLISWAMNQFNRRYGLRGHV